MTNEQAISYARLSGRKIGLSRQQIDDLRTIMLDEMDMLTESEAEHRDNSLTWKEDKTK